MRSKVAPPPSLKNSNISKKNSGSAHDLTALTWVPSLARIEVFFSKGGGVCLYIWDMSRYSDQLSISEYAYCIKLLTVKSWRVSRIPLPWSAQTKLIYIQTYNYEYITTLSIFISRYRTFHLILLLSVKVQFLNTIHVPSIF